MLRGNESNTKHALPDDGKRAEGETTMRRRFKWIQVDHRQVSGEVCRAELPDANQARRARLLLPSRSSCLRLSCGHAEKAERDFAAHRIDEDGY